MLDPGGVPTTLVSAVAEFPKVDVRSTLAHCQSDGRWTTLSFAFTTRSDLSGVSLGGNAGAVAAGVAVTSAACSRALSVWRHQVMRIVASVSERGFTFVELVVAIAVMASPQFRCCKCSDCPWAISPTRWCSRALPRWQKPTCRKFSRDASMRAVHPVACRRARSRRCVQSADCFQRWRSRANFDDVDDFDGLDESPPLDATGVVRSGFAGYRVQVSVAYPTAAQATAFGLDDPADAKLVVISVTPPGAQRSRSLHQR